MNKLSKRFLVGAAILFFILLLLSVDWYACSSGSRTQIETALSRELGMPVHIERLHCTLWSGLKATGVTLKAPASGAASETVLSVASVSARVAWWPLLSRRLVLKRLIFKEPTLVWGQSKPGVWALPIGKPAPASGGSSAPQVPLQKKRGESAKLEFNIRLLQIENGKIRLTDSKGIPLVSLEGVKMRSSLERSGKAEGTCAIQNTALQNGLIIEHFSTPFVWDAGTLTLARVDARLSGGSVRGSGVLAAGQEHPPFTLDLLFDSVDLNQLLAGLGETRASQRTAGLLQGNLDIYGNVGEKKSIGGMGQVRMRGGRMDQIPLLQLIGKMLAIEELNTLDLQQAQLDFRAGEGTVFIDSLVLESPNLSLGAQGTSDFDGHLDLAARLAIDSKLSRQLPAWMESNFQPIPGSDRRDIRFSVTGTLARPETNLMQVIMGQKFGNQILNLWQSLTGKKKKGDKKKPASEPMPADEADVPAESPPEPQRSATPNP